MSEEAIAIRTETIELGQFLKLAGLAVTGGEAKAILASGEVRVNGEPESRRGRKLRVGDVVEVGQISLRLVAANE